MATGYSPPLPVGTGPTTLYPTTLHTNTAFGRVDHRFSEKDQLNTRYSFYKLSSTNARGAGGLNAVTVMAHLFMTPTTPSRSATSATLSPRTFNETRGQFVYDSSQRAAE